MAQLESFRRIAKILARVTSDNENESMQSVRSAYARMKKDHVTFDDILTLDVSELYQAPLNRLLEHILNEQPDLSPTKKREQYAHYSFLIARKFIGGAEAYQDAHSAKHENAKSEEPSSRAEESQRYHERHGYSSNQHTANQAQEETTTSQDKKPFKQENTKTYKFFNVKLGKLNFSFSPATFFSNITNSFGQGTIWHSCVKNPQAAWHLLYASLIYACIASIVILFVFGILYSIVTFPIPEMSFASVFGALVATITITKAYLLYAQGWFN